MIPISPKRLFQPSSRRSVTGWSTYRNQIRADDGGSTRGGNEFRLGLVALLRAIKENGSNQTAIQYPNTAAGRLAKSAERLPLCHLHGPSDQRTKFIYSRPLKPIDPLPLRSDETHIAFFTSKCCNVTGPPVWWSAEHPES